MAGAKGRSGRKTHYEEMIFVDVVNASGRLCLDYIKDEKIPLEKRIEVAKHFALKGVPTKIEGDLNTTVTTMGRIERDGVPVEHDVGDAI